MLATGRSVAMTLPVLERLGLDSDYVVCSNGAITLGRDDDGPDGLPPRATSRSSTRPRC